MQNRTIFLICFLVVMAFVLPTFANAQYYTGLCTYHSYQRCSGSYLYWYDSCGNQQDVASYCSNGCYNNVCQNYNNNNYNNYSNCTYHAYKLCQGNNVYWYDSCGTQQDLYSTCTNGLVCQYGQCTTYVPVTPPQPTYYAHYKTSCYNNSVYWYDSLNVLNSLYKNCDDGNSCTIDSCSANKCVNTQKCDGSTCALTSSDYSKYCKINTVPAPVPVMSPTALSVSLFTKENASSTQWAKSAQVNSDASIYFMISVVNNSAVQADNITISSNIPTEITSLGNLQVNGVPITGDIVTGVNIGSIAPATSKTVTFEGKTQTISANATKQASAATTISGVTQSDTVSLNLVPGLAAASVTGAQAVPGLWEFLGRWYLWILGALILIFLFVMIYRRLSSEN